MKKSLKDELGLAVPQPKGLLERRSFIKYAGASVGAMALVLAGCKDDVLDEQADANAVAAAKTNEEVDLGSGDTGILNYAYALEQLEAAFYTAVVAHASFAGNFSDTEQIALTDIKNHEIVHREFFKTALGDKAIKDLEVDFSAINFSSRESVLNTARTFEDLGVAAYNGAGNLLTDTNLLLVAGKIVSVEARHASVLRDWLNRKSADFAGDNVVDSNGLDLALMPEDVLKAAQPFIKTKLSGKNLVAP
jgi:hypothetical protein